MVHAGLRPVKKELSGLLWGDKALLLTPSKCGCLGKANSSCKPGVARRLCALFSRLPHPLLLSVNWVHSSSCPSLHRLSCHPLQRGLGPCSPTQALSWSLHIFLPALLRCGPPSPLPAPPQHPASQLHPAQSSLCHRAQIHRQRLRAGPPSLGHCAPLSLTAELLARNMAAASS